MPWLSGLKVLLHLLLLFMVVVVVVVSAIVNGCHCCCHCCGCCLLCLFSVKMECFCLVRWAGKKESCFGQVSCSLGKVTYRTFAKLAEILNFLSNLVKKHTRSR